MIKKIPHTFALIFYIIVFAAILTWIIPGGEFNRETININNSKREVIVADSYHQVESKAQTWEIFSAFFKGFVDKAEKAKPKRTRKAKAVSDDTNQN